MIKSLDKFIENFSKWGIIICVFLMLSLTLLNIVMRWFQVSLHWIDPAVRHLVFLSAFLGGTLAIGNRHHIKIDLLSRLLERTNRKQTLKWVDIIVTTITITVTIVLVIASYNLAVIEFAEGKTVFLGIHTGYLLSIIPFGLGLMSFRFILRTVMTIKEGIK